MSNLDVIRAWKDEVYRNSLSADEQAQLPENPAGTIEELTDDELQIVDGGTSGAVCRVTFSWICAGAFYLSLQQCGAGMSAYVDGNGGGGSVFGNCHLEY